MSMICSHPIGTLTFDQSLHEFYLNSHNFPIFSRVKLGQKVKSFPIKPLNIATDIKLCSKIQSFHE